MSSTNSQRYKERRNREAKMLEVSSPDLGVDLMMESDMYSSLERGNTHKGDRLMMMVISSKSVFFSWVPCI